MPKLVISLTTKQKKVLHDNEINIADFLKVSLKTKMDDMIRVSEKGIDNIPGRVRNELETISDTPGPRTAKLKEFKAQGRLNFIDFSQGKFKQEAKNIIEAKFKADSVSITITPEQEAFLLCDMADPQEWMNNAIQVFANKLLARIK